MDLLFKRYASPFLIMDQMLSCNRFSEFVSEFVDIYTKEINDRDIWELYLHHPFIETSFDDFKCKLGIGESNDSSSEKVDFEATVKNTVSMLNDFVPE